MLSTFIFNSQSKKASNVCKCAYLWTSMPTLCSFSILYTIKILHFHQPITFPRKSFRKSQELFFF